MNHERDFYLMHLSSTTSYMLQLHVRDKQYELYWIKDPVRNHEHLSFHLLLNELHLVTIHKRQKFTYATSHSWNSLKQHSREQILSGIVWGHMVSWFLNYILKCEVWTTMKHTDPWNLTNPPHEMLIYVWGEKVVAHQLLQVVEGHNIFDYYYYYYTYLLPLTPLIMPF